jgi:transposase InsO family protein
MPWKEVTPMSSKLEFVQLALMKTEPFSTLCTRFNISRKTGYKLLNRYVEEGSSGLLEKSRRPHSIPHKTDALLEEKVIKTREWKKTWGGRKIRRHLLNEGETNVPAESTITDILRRHGYINEEEAIKHYAYKRFEHEAPNDLWQMDFKGHFEFGEGRCHPLTILDDHSRFSIGLRACRGERSITVQNHLINVFRRYGLPHRMNMDNGTPWACTKGALRYTALSIWLIRLGIKVSYSRIRHPQTNGKDERFHRTLKNELLQFHYFKTLEQTQKYFDVWRNEYNCLRPHEALQLEVPSQRYTISKRTFPEQLPPIEYPEQDTIRKVDTVGKISYKNQDYFISQALKGEYIALRELEEDKVGVYFCNQKITTIEKNLASVLA